MIVDGLVYRLVAGWLVVSLLGTSAVPPALRLLPRATAAYLGLMDHLGLLETDPTSPLGVRPTAPAGMKGLEEKLPTIGPDGEPVGFLLDADALALDPGDLAPPALTNPISVSRVQSCYTASGALGNALVLTFTVKNNLDPLLKPDLPVTATITDTFSATLALDVSTDPNVVHNVLLADDLLPANATLLSASPIPDRDGDHLAWNLGDIPPLGSVTATLRIQIPSAVAEFTDLDSGATAWGTHQGRQVSTSTAPASLSPDSFAEWLIWTIDADYYDEYMVGKAAELGNDWQNLFAYVRSLGYESYNGSLRGTRGTLWSEAGNSLDQASLLIAMLRGSGVPARYRHGTLSTARAQELILSMFPDPGGVIGHIPPGTEVSDPANDPQLLAETVDHWWVEAYLPGLGWTDLDPCFAGATPGDTFHEGLAADGTDQIAEVPDHLRHKVTMTLKVEQHNPLFFGTGTAGLRASVPLSYTFSTVELVGRPVTLGHLVNVDNPPSMVYYSLLYTYVPYFIVGNYDYVVEGDPFEEHFSNFPLSTFATTGEWLLFDLRDADGNVEHYERELVDRIGFETRQNGGTITFASSTDATPLQSAFDLYASHIVSSRTPPYALSDQQAVANQLTAKVADEAALGDGGTSPAVTALSARERQHLYHRLVREMLHVLGLAYHSSSDFGTSQVAQAMCVKAYPHQPSITIAANHFDTDTFEATASLDLLHTDRRISPHPGQNATDAPYAYNLFSGMMDSTLESVIVRQVLSQLDAETTVAGTSDVFLAADEQGIEARLVMDQQMLADLPLSGEAQARISATLDRGLIVIVPCRMVLIGGEETIAWWEIDPETGRTAGVGEQGMHSTVVVWTSIAQKTAFLAGLVAGFGLAVLAFPLTLISLFLNPPQFLGVSDDEVLQGTKKDMAAWSLIFLAASAALAATGAILRLLASSVAIGGVIGAMFVLGLGVGFAAGIGLMMAVLGIVNTTEPPLPAMYVDPVPGRGPPPASVQALVPASPTHPGQQVSATIAVAHASLQGQQHGDWVSTARSALSYTALTNPLAELREPSGSPLASGAVQAQPVVSSSLAVAQGAPLTYDLAGSGSTSSYAPAVSGLGLGTGWLTYSAELVSASPHTLSLFDTIVTIDGTDVYSGDFTLVATGPTALTGSGPTAAPTFAPGASIQASGADLHLGPATVLAGSLPLDGSNGIALAGYTGALTIAEHSATLDQVELDGTFGQGLALALDPAASSIPPVVATTFDAQIASNLADTYTVTVEGPPGWHLDVNTGGTAVATPPLGAQPGAYVILVTARSSSRPALVASASHTVTVSEYQGMDMDLAQDPLISVPWGPAAPEALPGDTNNGQIQLPDAAYTVDITNTSTISHPFDVTISGDVPPEWWIISTPSLTLPAGGVGRVGLYVSPTVTALPSPGTTYPFTATVTASDGSGLQDSDTDLFVVPAIAFNHLALDPPLVYASAHSTATFDVTLTNVGNAAGSFPLTITLPLTTWTQLTPHTTPVVLAASDTDRQSVVVSVPGALIGERHAIQVASAAPDTGYVQRANIEVQIVSSRTLPIYQTAQRLLGDCQVAGDVTLPAAVSFLGTAINDLEGSCQGGACSLTLRDRVVSGAYAVANHAAPLSPLITAAESFRQIAAAMSGHTTPAQLLADTGNLAGAAALLETEACAVAHHGLDASLVPAAIVTLEQSPATYDLRLSNEGSLTTTAVLTLTPPAGTTGSWSTDSVSLLPGQIVSLPTVITPTSQGVFLVKADVAAGESPVIHHQAMASLSVVDALLQVGNVAASPSFVEYGAAVSSAVYADVANVANRPIAGNASLSVLAGDGTEVYSDTTPVSIPSSLVPVRTILGHVDTSNICTGTFTITLSILDQAGVVIPKATGQGMLAVGQAVEATSQVVPDVVLPGTVTVTTKITTQLSQAVLDQLASAPGASGPLGLGVGDSAATTAGVETTRLLAPDATWPVTVTLSAHPTHITADGTSTSTLTATVQAEGGGPVDDGTEVVFTADSGSLATTPVTETTVSGLANAILTAGTLACTATVTATATAGITSTAGITEVVFLAGPAADLIFIAAPTQSVAGAPFDVTVQAQDAYGNVATSYTGTVAFSSSDPQATLPPTYTFTSGDAGQHTFAGLVLRTAGSQDLTVTDENNGSLSDTESIDVATGSVDTGTSQASATSPHQADGVETCTVVVTTTDSYSNPVSGADVWVVASGTGNTISGSPGTTNSSGLYTATLTSTQPQAKIVQVLVGDGQTMDWLPNPLMVEFTGSTIGGTVFSDPNQDDVRQGGEPGLGGVQVTLYEAGAPDPLKATVTASAGGYTFTGLFSGTYRLEQAQLDEYAFSGSGLLTVTVGAFATSTGHDLGNHAAAQASGTVWHDGDQDGLREQGEQPIPGVTIHAFDAAAALVDTATTGAQGTYGLELPAPMPLAPDNFVFNGGPLALEEPASALIGNGDFSHGQTPLDPATYPANYDFSSGDLGGWTPGTGNVSVVSDSYSYDGHYLLISYRDSSVDSPAFTVPADAQALHFAYYGWTNRNATESVPLTVYVLSGPTFGSATNIGAAWGSRNTGWRTETLDLKAFRGRTVKLRFASDTDNYRAGRARLDNVTLRTVVPDWTPSDSLHVQIISDTNNLDGPYLRLNRRDLSIQSPPFLVPADAQSLRFRYLNWTDRNSNESTPLIVYALSGTGFGTSTQIATVTGTLNQGWKTAVIDIQAYQAQVIRLRFASDTDNYRSGKARVDDVCLHVEIPGWAPSNANLVRTGMTSLPQDPGTTAPENPDFGQGLTPLDVATYPPNYDFSMGRTALDPSTYPANYDFSSGTLGGWTASSGNVTVVSDTYNLDGYHLRINYRDSWADSPVFAVPPDAESLRFYYYAWTDRNATEWVPLNVYILNGTAFETATNIGQVGGARNNGWRSGVLDLQAFRGQTVKLRFASDTDNYRAGRARVDNISLNREIPGWAASDVRYVRVVSDTYNLDGSYLRLNGRDQWIDSPAFEVPDDVQSLRFNYLNWTARNANEAAPLTVYVRSGAGYGTSTSIGTRSSSFNQGWRSARLDLQAFRGQTIKLRFASDTDNYRAGRARVDNLSLNVEVPGWDGSSFANVVVDDSTAPADPGVSAPANGGFNAGLTALSTSTYPGNYDFNQGLTPLPTSTYPANYDFASGSLGGWSPSSGAVSVVSDTHSIDGYYLLIDYRDAWADSPAFTVPANAQSLRFQYQGWTTRSTSEDVPLTVYVRSGHSFETSTNIGAVLASAEDPWLTARLNLQAFQGQVVKLRFASDGDNYRAGRARVDNISLNQEVPLWRPSNTRYVVVVSDTHNIDGRHLLLDRRDETIDTEAFEVPSNAQSLRFQYQAWADRNPAEYTPLHVYVLNGADFELSTQLASLSSNRNEGWRTTALNLQSFRGQTIKLRFASDTDNYRAGKARLDSVSLNIEVPDWVPSNPRYVRIGNTDPITGNYLLLNSRDMFADSVPFLVPTDTDSLQLNYHNWTDRNAAEAVPLHVGVYAGAGYGIYKEIGAVSGSNNDGWKQATLDLTPFRGRVVKLRFGSDTDNYRAGKAKIDNVALVVGTGGAAAGNDTPPGEDYLYLTYRDRHATSSAFYVPLDTVSLRFNYLVWTDRNYTENAPLHVYALNGEGFGTSTLLSTLSKSAKDGWLTATLGLDAFQGQVIKLRFASDTDNYRAGKAKVDNLTLVTGAGGAAGGDYEDPGGEYLYLGRRDTWATSVPLSVPTGISDLHFHYFTWATRNSNENAPVYLFVLSGPDFGTGTEIAHRSSSYNDGWQETTVDLSAYEEQTIKLRFASDHDNYRNGRCKVDNVYLLPLSTTPYTITEINPVNYTSSTSDSVGIDAFGGGLFTVDFGDYAVDRYLSTVEVSPTELVADGVTTATVTITLRDGDGDPLPDYDVEIIAPGTSVTVDQPAQPTDLAGQATGAVRSTFAPQVVMVTARTISDNVTLAASVPVTFTPGIPDADRSSLVAAPAAVVANGVDTAVFTATLRDEFDNLVAGKTVSVTAESTWPVTLTQPLTQTNTTGQVTGTVRSAHDQTATLGAYDATDGITVTQTADVLFSSVDPQISTVEAVPGTLVADGVSTATITVTLRDEDGLPLAGKAIQVEVDCVGCTLDGQPVSGAVDLGLSAPDGTATAALASSAAEIVTLSASGDGIPLDAGAQVTFTVGPVDAGASQLHSSATTVVADGVSYATLTATLYDSYSHPVPGKTTLIQSTGINLLLSQPVTATDTLGQVQATLSSSDVQTVTVSAFDQTDNLTLTQTVEIDFIAGPADAVQSSLSLSPTTVLADGVQTTTITATLRDAQLHPIAGRTVQLVVTGQGNTITPAALGDTDQDGTIVFHVASTAVQTKDVSVRDVPNNVTLPVGQVQFVAGAVDPDASGLSTDKTTVLLDVDQATLTATLYDSYGHHIPDKAVLIGATGLAVTVTQPVTLTNSQGRVQATVRSTAVQTSTVSAFDQTDNLTVTQTVELTFVAGPADAARSSIAVSPTTVVADNVATTTITATLRDERDNPLRQRAVQLLVSGSSNSISPGSQQTTDASGTAIWQLASSRAETKDISVRDVLGDATLPAGQVTFVPGPLSPSHSTVTANATRGPADGVTPITVTVRTLDALYNPIAGLVVTLTASIPGVTITQPLAPSDASGYAYARVVGTTYDPVTIRAYAGGILLDPWLVLTFEPVYAYSVALDPAAQTTAVGGVATYDVAVSNDGYQPDDYTLELFGLDTLSTTLGPLALHLAAGEIGHATLAAWTGDCGKAGDYPFFVRVSSAAVGTMTTVPGDLTITSEPVLYELSPDDGAAIGATSALFSWQTAVSATTSLFLKEITATHYTEYTGTAGTLHQVAVDGLARNTDYGWYARSESICGPAESPTRTLHTLNGIVFTQREYSPTVQRDYNQLTSVAVYNQDVISHTVVVTLENPYPELVIGFVGEGSIDDPFSLQPGQTRTIQLVVHAADVTQSDFELVARLTADDGTADPIEDAVPIHLHVHIPNYVFSIEQTAFDTQTLVGSYRVSNQGDPLTDLAITVEVSGTGTVYLLPAMSHGYLDTGKSFAFEAIPAIDTSFQSISGTIYATAGGVMTSTAISLSLPAGTSMFLGEASDVSLESGAADWYCTNRPVIENRILLPPGFRRNDVSKAQFLFKIDSRRSWRNVRPHDVHIFLNNDEIGALLNTIPHGMYTFPVQPDTLNESLVGPSVNNVRLETLHLNGGHYVVASDMMLFLCLTGYREWVAATSQAEADQIVSSRSFLVPAPTLLEPEILAPTEGETVVAGVATPIKVHIVDDLTQSVFYEVTATADNGNGTVVLYDDGVHDDGAYRDGVYANTWVPVNEGPTTLTIHAGSCTIAGEAQVTVTVQLLSYDVSVAHQVPLAGTDVLTGTAAPPPQTIVPGPEHTEIDWTHTLTAAHATQQDSFDLVLPGLQPGEMRQVASGTVISYTGPGGSGLIHLPPLHVTAQRLVAITPPTQTVNLGGRAAFQVHLLNPGTSEADLDLSVGGLPASWVDVVDQVSLAAGAQDTVPLTITVPADAALGETPFAVAVETESGGRDQAGAALDVVDLLELGLAPWLQTVLSGQAVSYTLTVTNLEAVARTYALSHAGLAGNSVALSPTVDVAAHDAVSLPLGVTAYASHGAHPFAVTATAVGGVAQRDASAILQIGGDSRVAASLAPSSARGGPGVTTFYTLTVANTGNLSDTYDIGASVPAGWSYELQANGQVVNSLTLSPFLFNQADLLLMVTPATSATPASYPLSVQVQSQRNPQVSAVAGAELVVTQYGVQVEITPASRTLAPTASDAWQVLVTNTGSEADTYDLSAGGILAPSGQFSPNPISVDAGEQESVQFTAGPVSFALAETFPLAVTAHSLAEPDVWGYDTAEVTFLGAEAVALTISPTHIILTDTTTAQYLVLITNTGNVDTVYSLSRSSQPAGPGLKLETDELYIAPHMMSALLLSAEATQAGLFTLTVQADSTTSAATGSDQATLTVEGAQYDIYLPLLFAGHTVPARAKAPSHRLYLPLLLAGYSREREAPPEPTPEPPAPLEADYRLYLPVLVRPGGPLRDARP